MYRPIYPTLCALLVCLFTLPSALAWQTPPDPLLANATTDCGPRNTPYKIRWNEPFIYGDLESGRRRYGPCFGGGPLCNDLNEACIETENEAARAEEWLTALMAGRCDPPRGVLRPSIQTRHDWTYALRGKVSAMRDLQKKYEQMGCAVTGPVGGTNSFTCPSGQSCKPPCPVCPVCEVCPACPPVTPAGTPVSMATTPPENTPLLLWDRLDSERVYRGKRVGDVYLVGAVRLKAEDFSHWMEVPRPVK